MSFSVGAKVAGLTVLVPGVVSQGIISQFVSIFFVLDRGLSAHESKIVRVLSLFRSYGAVSINGRKIEGTKDDTRRADIYCVSVIKGVL